MCGICVFPFEDGHGKKVHQSCRRTEGFEKKGLEGSNHTVKNDNILCHSLRQSSSISARRELIDLVLQSSTAGVGVVKTVHWKVMMTPLGELMRLSLSLLMMSLTVTSI